MTDDKYLDLMHEELDGVNSPGGSAELKRYLDSNVEASRYFEELGEMFRIIDADPERKPPPDLLNNILESIPFGKYTAARAIGRGVVRWGGWFFGSRLRYAGTFAAGIAIGVIVYATVGYDGSSDTAFDNSLIYGTMRPAGSTNEFRQIQSTGIDLDEVDGQVRVYGSRDALVADIYLKSRSEIEWVLQYDNNDVSLEGFRHLDGQDCEVAAAPTETRVHQHGDNRYIVFFSNNDRSSTSIVIKVFSADQKLLFEKILTSAAPE